MSTSRKTEAERLDRPVRVPIHKARDVLAVTVAEDKVPRWFADRGNRIQVALNAGYQFVTDKDTLVGERKVDGDKAVGQTISKMGDKDGTLLYLMAIDRDLYESDQRAKQISVDKSEEAIYADTQKEGHYGEFNVKVTS